ncbi:hypothetical protein BCR33DRAFT_659270 [Rhizoclosmatium globosum]|uniref:Uncharacterized protein n=1 Tax=Rhizoclosmatium globosum TaxID=329046 RepID=A0A1Y2CDU7_9FUNG|nr:hypothetical protein BCR33DRAFT_659270 [Rhizoclosmatium globosum]|eukprot:ORY45240.1 hypothetical protein BCR33DRAFT_659270 [Rhizoclosmatium globosum]
MLSCETPDSATTTNESKPCWFYFTRGSCRKGAACAFSHSKTVTTQAPTPPTCIFFVKGTCKKADNCLYSHSLPSNGDSNSTDEDMPVDFENSTLCSICYEVPETFGLLLNCSHIFCLNCARKWRNKGSKDGALAESNAIKECALCRSKSALLVPSTSFPRSQQEKDDIVLKYRAKMALIPCKYYKRSSNPQRKRCPFADDCLFGHFDGNGMSNE